jgi:broad specificity phosphatase PhoE
MWHITLAPVPAFSHALIARLSGSSPFLAIDICFERLDHTEADTDVTPSAQALAGIEHVAALDHKIELVIWTHGGVCRALAHRSKGK